MRGICVLNLIRSEINFLENIFLGVYEVNFDMWHFMNHNSNEISKNKKHLKIKISKNKKHLKGGLNVASNF
jgi:hypothetical protein